MQDRFEQNKFQRRRWCDDRFGDNAETGAGFDVEHHRADQAGGVREARHNRRLAAACDDGVVQPDAFAARQDDQLFTGERAPRKRTASRKGVVGRNNQTEAFLVKLDGAQSDGFVNKHRARDRGREAAARDHFPNAFGSAFLKVNGNARITSAILAQKCSQERLRGRANVTEAKFPFLARGGAPDAAVEVIDLLQEVMDFAQQHGTGRGQPDAVACPFEEGRAHGTFKLLDRAAEGGLRDVQALGGTRETEFLGDGLEVAELAQVHGAVMLNRHNHDSQELFPLKLEFGKDEWKLAWRGQPLAG